jgi:TonB family protein
VQTNNFLNIGMLRAFITFLFFVLLQFYSAQSITVNYYKNLGLQKEVAPEKAAYSKTTRIDEDGTISVEVLEMKTGVIISAESSRNAEPFGVWKVRRGSRTDILDYQFALVYSEQACADTIAGLSSYFENDQNLNYSAPVLENDLSIFDFVSRNVIFPIAAVEQGIQGRVFLRLTITESGQVQDVIIQKGIHVLLDKEAARVVRSMKFRSPPQVHGLPRKVCVALPVNFKLM